MSVVNRMLLDIDRRHATAEIEARGPYPDVRSVPVTARAPRRRGFAVVAIVVVALLGLAAVIVERAGRSESPPTPARSIATPAPAPAKAAPAVAPPPTVVAATPAEPGAPAAPSAPEAPKKAPRAHEGVASFEPFKLSRKLSPVEERTAVVRPPQAAMPSLRISLAEPAAAPRPAAPLRQVAADETVAAARTLWNDGARSGALATLREALTIAESARNAAAVAPLARELARLEVADNRPQPALELLRRLEPALADDAEAWALRGNVEQRLALHAESARSYLAALRMRPAEGRWMLGAAISLAADGKLDEAQAWAERARERGVLTPSIEGYLQQLGVVARR